MLTQDELQLAQKYKDAWKTKEDFLKDLWEYRIFRDWWNQVNQESQVPTMHNQKTDTLMLMIIVPVFVIFMYILFFQIINRLFYYTVLWTLFPKE